VQGVGGGAAAAVDVCRVYGREVLQQRLPAGGLEAAQEDVPQCEGAAAVASA
jgi:hypothetical protein